MPPKSDVFEDILDISKNLKQEKILKQNLDKIVELRNNHKKKQESKEQKKASLFPFFTKYSIFIFLLIIILIAAGTRFYVASMPITTQWAEKVVQENLKNQVTQQINKKYPTLSEEKKSELIQEGAAKAFSSMANQQAITELEEHYKNSYRDPDGQQYLYEIDPYYFYEEAIAEIQELSSDKYNLLAMLERWLLNLMVLIFPDIRLITIAFYLPLVFTILTIVALFLLAKEVWDVKAAFFATLFFVIQPIVLEFSLLGFGDTNMLNMFFIISSGFVFLLFVKSIKVLLKNKKNYSLTQWLYFKKSFMTITLFFSFIALVLAFSYTWSAWYVALLLPLGACVLAVGGWCMRVTFLFLLKRNVNKEYIIFCFVLFLILLGIGFVATKQHEKVLSLLPNSVQKYIHFSSYDNPFGYWPEGFVLIKELQITKFGTLVTYIGGALYILLGCVGFCVMVVNSKRWSLSALYVFVGTIAFAVLSFRAIRLLPYFISFFAIAIGVGMSTLLRYCQRYAEAMTRNEAKGMKYCVYILVYFILVALVIIPLIPAIKEKTQLMPIMDDVIYDSAVYIKERSNGNAIISSWWDRGTFYEALAERKVHLHSQPHMPRTYWLSFLYTTDNDIEAQNTISMLNCNYAEFKIFQDLNVYFSREESINIMKEILIQPSFDELHVYLNNILNGSMEMNDRVADIENTLTCKDAREETYIVLIDDIMPRFSGVQYFAAWDYNLNMPDPSYPFTDLNEGSCAKMVSGIYCEIANNKFFVNMTNLSSIETKGTVFPQEIFLAYNQTIYHEEYGYDTGMSLIIYPRDGYWKALFIPKQVADSFYVRLMLLDGYGFSGFEKVFEEVHVETSWVKVYKMHWNDYNEWI